MSLARRPQLCVRDFRIRLCVVMAQNFDIRPVTLSGTPRGLTPCSETVCSYLCLASPAQVGRSVELDPLGLLDTALPCGDAAALPRADAADQYHPTVVVHSAK